MDADQFSLVSEIFLEANELPRVERRAFLDARCGGQPEIRAEVESLLQEESDVLTAIDVAAGGLRSQLEDIRARVNSEASEQAGSYSQSLGEMFDEFQLVRLIGHGGMGDVYEAKQFDPPRQVAIKMVQLQYRSDRILRRFKREAGLLAQLNHPGIAQIYGSGVAETARGTQPYIVMECVDGVPADRYVHEHELDSHARLDLLTQICDAVDHAHQQGIVHRDLKPPNILVTREGRVKILDFGVARAMDAEQHAVTLHTDVGQIIGTVPYMSPEQISGDSTVIDPRSDVYTLGVVAFELLVERRPYDVGDLNLADAARVICEQPASRLQSWDSRFRGDIDTIVGKALSKERERRYANAGEMAADLRRAMRNEPIAARPTSTWYRVSKFAQRERALVAGVAVAFASLLIGIVLVSNFALSESRQKRSNALLAARANLAAAGSNLRIGNVRVAQDSVEAVPEELRGWEWRYFNAQLDAALVTRTGAFAGTSADRRQGHPQIIVDLADGSLGVYSIPDLAQIGTVQHERPMRLSTYTPDGSRIAAATDDGRVVLFDTESLRAVTELDVGASDGIAGLALDASGTRLAVIYPPKTVRIWDVGRRVVTHETVVSGRGRWTSMGRESIAFHPHEPTVAFARNLMGGTGDVGLWHYERNEFTLVRSPKRDTQKSVAFTPDGSVLATGSRTERLVHLWDGHTMEYRSLLLASYPPLDLEFSMDSSHLFVAGGLGVSTMEWRTGVVSTQRTASDRLFGALAVDETQGLAVTAGNDALTLWSLRDDGLSRTLVGHENFVYQVAYSPDGSILATGGWDRTVRLWDPCTGEQLAALPVNSIVWNVAFSADGTELVGAGFDSAWDVATGLSRTLPEDYNEVEFTTNLNESGRAVNWSHMRAHAPRHRVTIEASGLVSWDERMTFQNRRQDAGNSTVVFDPTGDLYAASVRGELRIHDTATGEVLASRSFEADPVLSVAFSPDGSRIATGHRSGALYIWTSLLKQQVAELEGHANYIRTLTFSPDGTQLASASGDFTAKIWDTRSRGERFAQSRREAVAREKMVPYVDDMFERANQDPREVARLIRADSSLSSDSRKAALRILLRRCRAEASDP